MRRCSLEGSTNFLGGGDDAIDFSSLMLDNRGGVENFFGGFDKFVTGLTIFKLNEVSLNGDKMLSVDNRLRLDVCKGSGVRFDEMFGEPTALTSRSGEKT